MPTEIIVRGSFAAQRAPERATVHATVSHEGPEMEPVYERAAADAETLTVSVAALRYADGGPVTRWSSEQLHTWSERPWNSEGRQLPLVHHASISIAVTFKDFAALSKWVGDHLLGTVGFQISGVAWELTDAHRAELAREVQLGAVRDAVQRAQRYADALGLGEVRPVTVADAGMLGHGSPADGVGAPRMMAMKSSAPQIELVPADVEIAVSVDARFQAGAPA